ncbi:hypothetical protein [Methylobacter sp.]|nr:hypothetical protein [Methylobacter sp.]MDI1277977.1 hypothetical protein [Methylobacter sp.]MDI1358768.1 hypothetical protein [Methylobacter sp.]
MSMAVSSNDRQRHVVKLLVATRKDVGGMKISQKKIDHFMKDYAGL